MSETAEKGNSNNFEKWIHITTLAGKFVLTISVLSYVLGLLAANIYFGQFGVSTLFVMKVNCFLTGAWMIIPLFISGIIIFAMRILVKDRSLSKKDKVKRCLLFIVIIIVLLGMFNHVLRSLFGIETTTKWLLVLLWLLFMMATSQSFVNTAMSRTSDEKNIFSVTAYGCVYIAVHVVLFFVLLLIYISMCTRYIYPSIPPYIGGLKPVSVQIFIDPKSEIKNSLSSCGLSQQADGSWKGKLILATDREFIFAVKDANEAISVRREEVRAIKYYPGLKLFGKLVIN